MILGIGTDLGADKAREIVLQLWGDRITTAEAHVNNAKSDLQEWAQARGMATPMYVEVSREGPAHAPRFTIEARLTDGRTAAAEAGSKRQAEQEAAAALLGLVKGQNQ